MITSSRSSPVSVAVAICANQFGFPTRICERSLYSPASESLPFTMPGGVPLPPASDHWFSAQAVTSSGSVGAWYTTWLFSDSMTAATRSS